MDNCRMNQPDWRSNAPYMPYRNMRQTMPENTSRNTCPSCQMRTPDRRDNCQEQMPRRRDMMANMPLAMAYVPWQTFAETFDLCKALQVGTIFPELCLPFCGTRRKCR